MIPLNRFRAGSLANLIVGRIRAIQGTFDVKVRSKWVIAAIFFVLYLIIYSYYYNSDHLVSILPC